MVHPAEQSPTRSIRHLVATAAVAGGLLAGGVLALGSNAGAATNESTGHDAHGMHDDSMMNMMSDMEMMGDSPMGRVHGEMLSRNPDMRRMHAHMMSRHPEMRQMHADMVSGGRSTGE